MEGTKTKSVSDFIELVTSIVYYRDVCGVTGLVGVERPEYPIEKEGQKGIIG